MPRTITADSWGSVSSRSNAGSASSPFTPTHWSRPLPSRTTRNLTLPLPRRWWTQPRTVTSSPAWRPRSSMRTGVEAIDSWDTGTPRETKKPPAKRGSDRVFPPGAETSSRVEELRRYRDERRGHGVPERSGRYRQAAKPVKEKPSNGLELQPLGPDSRGSRARPAGDERRRVRPP